MTEYQDSVAASAFRFANREAESFGGKVTKFQVEGDINDTISIKLTVSFDWKPSTVAVFRVGKKGGINWAWLSRSMETYSKTKAIKEANWLLKGIV